MYPRRAALLQLGLLGVLPVGARCRRWTLGRRAQAQGRVREVVVSAACNDDLSDVLDGVELAAMKRAMCDSEATL